MKKVYKLMCCCATFFIIFIIAVVLYGVCINWYKGNRPSDQPGTEWFSEDESIVIHVDKNNQSTGSMIIGGTEIPFLFLDGQGEVIYIYSIDARNRDVLYPEDKYETWMGSFNRKDKFTVTVEKTTYFEVGQKITFYRVDDEEDSSK